VRRKIQLDERFSPALIERIILYNQWVQDSAGCGTGRFILKIFTDQHKKFTHQVMYRTVAPLLTEACKKADINFLVLIFIVRQMRFNTSGPDTSMRGWFFGLDKLFPGNAFDSCLSAMGQLLD
jgi:hypothetical protein